jgi:hypothetical protein
MTCRLELDAEEKRELSAELGTHAADRDSRLSVVFGHPAKASKTANVSTSSLPRPAPLGPPFLPPSPAALSSAVELVARPAFKPELTLLFPRPLPLDPLDPYKSTR